MYRFVYVDFSSVKQENLPNPNIYNRAAYTIHRIKGDIHDVYCTYVVYGNGGGDKMYHK